MANAKIIEMKAQQVAEIKEKIAKAQSMVVFDYRGLTVEEVTALRNDMRKAGVEYVVLKNSIVERAAKEDGIDEKIKDYTETYVICSECGRPDTHIEKEDRTFILVCEACGARRPIMVRKAAKAEDANTLRPGDVIEVTINDVGKKGDGVGKYMDYLIIVPGTTRGTRTNVKITNISAKTAFGQVTTEAVNH